MNNDIDNGQDVIDSRDVISRIEELIELKEAVTNADAEWQDALDNDASQDEIDDLEREVRIESDNFSSEEREELMILESVTSEAIDYCPDWPYGAPLIRDSYFQEYARELADDLGAVNSDATWPNNCIDWEQAANELQMDYTAIDFDGTTYWIR